MRQPNDISTLVLLARITGVGWYIAACIAGGTLVGVWLDGQLGTKPAFLLAGLAIGIVAAFLGMIQILRRFAGEHAAATTEKPLSPGDSTRKNTDRLDR
ncbi:MAG: AtpZ/AtpI family protein [Chloroflexi bacterium]|nr:AtpZ/AtpI family protein [Chloroflexota bacterium]